MQRQSLGSPPSKLQIHGGNEEVLETKEKRSREMEPNKEDEKKIDKPLRSSSTAEASVIHLIPLITILCFLILVLVSHTPSDIDLPNIGGVRRFSDPKETSLGKLIEVERREILAIRSHRSLQEVAKKLRKSRSRNSPRKFGDF